MAGSVNKVILVGNLGNEPEVRVSQDNKKLVRLSIATSENWKDKISGERKSKTEWHRVVIFATGLADIAEKYLKKGSKVYIEGQLQTRKFNDQAGNEKYTTEIVLQQYNSSLHLLDSKNENFDNIEKNLNIIENKPADDIPKMDNLDVDDDVPF